jgi:hypothetical protein
MQALSEVNQTALLNHSLKRDECYDNSRAGINLFAEPHTAILLRTTSFMASIPTRM